MYFDSVQALLEMEGHGVYVWSAYGVALTMIIILVASPILKKRRFFIEQRMKLRREEIAKQHQREQPLQS
jgi:heme exporter protein D